MLEGQDDKSSNITKKKSIGFFWGNLPSRCVCVRINYTYSTYICFYSIFIYFYIYTQILSNEEKPGCSGFIRDYTTQMYGDYNKPL